MDESSGTTFAQSGSSTAAAFTSVGSVVPSNAELIPGDSTKFATFNAGSYATAAKGNVVLPFTTLTTACIVKWQPPLSASMRLLSFGGNGETEAVNYMIHDELLSDTSMHDLFESGAGTNTDIPTSKTLDPRYNSPVTSVPLFLVVSRNNTTKKTRFYVNGKLFEEVSYSGAPSGGTSSIFVLSQNTAWGIAASPQPFTFGHVSYFDRVLSDEEVFGMASSAGLADAGINEVRFDAEYTTAPTQTILNRDVNKILLTAVDPLIDISVAFPDDAYSEE